MRDNKLRDWVTIGIAALALVFSLLVEYTHNDKDNANRISALESHRADDKGQLDHIQQQVDKLVDWVIGKK